MAILAVAAMLLLGGRLAHAQDTQEPSEQATKRPVLERFLPDTTRWFLLVRDFPKLAENHLTGFVGTALDHPALSPLKRGEITGANLPNVMAVLREFDLSRLAQHIDGDLLIFCTQMGPLPEFNLDGHLDLVMAFHHRGRQQELLEMFESAVHNRPADAVTTRESIGGFDVMRIHYTYPVRKYAPTQPTPTRENPRPTPNIITVQAPMDYQFVITENLAIFAEGSNVPLRDVLNKLSRPRDGLMAARSMRRALTLLDDKDTPLPGITLGFTQAFMQDFPPFDGPETDGVFDFLGLKELQLVLLNLDTQRRRHEVRVLAMSHRDASPLLGLGAFATPVQAEDFSDIPAQAIQAAVTRYRVGDALRHLMQVLPQKWPAGVPLLALLPLEGNRILGVNPLDGILYQLGERHVSYSFPGNTASGNPLFVLRFGLNSPGEMAQTLSTMMRHVVEAEPELANVIEIIPEGSGELYALKLPKIDATVNVSSELTETLGAMAVGRTALVVSSDLGMLRKGLEAEGTEGGFASDRQNARLLRRLPRGTFSVLLARPQPMTQQSFQALARAALLQLWQYEALEADVLREAWSNIQALPNDKAQQPVLEWEEHSLSTLSLGDDHMMGIFSISPARLVPATTP